MCKKTITLVAAIALFLWVGAVAQAHPGHSHGNERTWTVTVTNTKVLGTFVSEKEGTIQIRRADDSLVALPLSQLSEADQQWIGRRREIIRQLNHKVTVPPQAPAVQMPLLEPMEDPYFVAQVASRKPNQKAVEMVTAFEAYVKSKAIKTRFDDRFFYVESNGIPDHRMMVGITAWQQQVPLPQAYVGENAWRIPLQPVPAKEPVSAKGRFLRGAIALAVNGIPIFNPLNNRGDDAYLFGELDEFGGHCGRADDYHYHIAPVHLEKTIGKGLPIAYALDGYPIYGYEEPDGSEVKGLDSINGHKDEQGNYHYHATKKYPYLNGGFYGVVTEREGQVDPQPRAQPIRPDLRPLRDAKIVDFKESKPGSYNLVYEVKGKKGSVSYSIGSDGAVKFVFVDTSGNSTSETYSSKRRAPGGGGKRPPLRPGEGPPPRDEDRPPPPPRKEEQASARPKAASKRTDLPQLTVTSSVFDPGGTIPSDFTCDGTSSSPPVQWEGAPQGTKSFVLSLWHTAPDQEKSYWMIYNIPADVTTLSKNSKGVGKVGLNDKRRAEYDPMCSKGPGKKTYHITVFALSEELKLAPDKANRASVLAAIKDITLAEGTVDFQYERKR